MSVEYYKQMLADKANELEKLKGSFEEFQETSRGIENELEGEIFELKQENQRLKSEKNDLNDLIVEMKRGFLNKSSVAEQSIQLLSQEKSELENSLQRVLALAKAKETDCDEYKESLREKDFEIERITEFYHNTLEDLALTCAELEDIKDVSSESTQRLKEQILELKSDLAAARRKSTAFSVRGLQMVRASVPANFMKDETKEI